MPSIILRVVLVVNHFLVSRAFGADIIPNPLESISKPSSGLQCIEGIQCVAVRVVGFLLEIAVPLTAIMVLVGGFMMITAGGDPEKFSKGKKTLLYAASGFVVVLLANGIVQVIQSIFK